MSRRSNLPADVFGVLLQVVPIMTWIERRGSAAIQLRLGEGFPLWQAIRDSPAGSPREVRRAARDLERRGLRVAALGYYRNMLASDPAERQKIVEALRQTGGNRTKLCCQV